MASLYTQQDSNIRKTWFLFVTFLVVVISLGWAFSGVFGDPNILYVAVIFSVLMNIAGYWWSDKIALSMSGAKPMPNEGDYREIYRLTENLCITAGLPMPRLYLIPDTSANAFATGRDPKHSAVALTEGIIRMLDRSELEGVIAHELAHIGNRDMLLGTAAVVLVGFVAIVSDIFLRSMAFGGGGDRKVHPLVIVAGIVLSIFAPIIAKLIQLAISRRREFLADASGALLTRYPEGLASALQKIGGQAKGLSRPNHATAHLFFANPFGATGKSKLSIDRLFATHPPIEERVNALKGIELN